MVQRLTLRRRLSYNTNSNKRSIRKTPGGKLVYIYQKKIGTVPLCGDCRERRLPGIKPTRPFERARLSKRVKTVNRTYGGSRCHQCVKDRIVRAFLVEEQKIISSVMKMKAKTAK